MQNTEGFAALIGANKGCFAAFAAVYDCPVPVIAAVQRLLRRRRHRPGRQRRRRSSPATTPSSGSPRSTAARSAPPPTSPGSCPQHKMRAMVYTGATATAAELHAFGSVLRVVPRDELRDAAFEVAADDRGEVARR